MSDINQPFSNCSTLQPSLDRLDAELKRLIKGRFAEYDASMQISSKEYFADCVEEFLASFSVAMNNCSSELKRIAYSIGRHMKATLLNFHEYVVRGMWLLWKSPDCEQQIMDYYFIPETFDVDCLNELLAEIRSSVSFEGCIENLELRKFLHALQSNLLNDLVRIKGIVDGDRKDISFAVRRWVVKFRSDVRELRHIYKERWEQGIRPSEGESASEALLQIRNNAMEELEDSDFYITNLDDTSKLVANIHRMQRKCCGEELDKFLYNYALLEFLDEKLAQCSPKGVWLQSTKIENNFYGHFTNNGTLNGNINNNGRYNK